MKCACRAGESGSSGVRWRMRCMAAMNCARTDSSLGPAAWHVAKTESRTSSRQPTEKRDDLNIRHSVRGPGTRAKAAHPTLTAPVPRMVPSRPCGGHRYAADLSLGGARLGPLTAAANLYAGLRHRKPV